MPFYDLAGTNLSLETLQREEADANFVLTATGKIVEIQATAEEAPFACRSVGFRWPSETRLRRIGRPDRGRIRCRVRARSRSSSSVPE